MAEDKLNKSLDELVKESRKENALKKKKKISSKAGGDDKKKKNTNASGKAKASGPSSGARKSSVGATPYSKASTPGKSIMLASEAKPKAPLTTGCKVLVSNLNKDITVENIKDIFEEYGPLKSVDYVKPGCIDVIFKNKDDAIRCINDNNQRELDNRPMNVRLFGTPAPARTGAGSSSTPGSSRGGKSSATGKTPEKGNKSAPKPKAAADGADKKKKSPKPKPAKKAPVSVEDLNKEMEAFIAQNASSSEEKA